MGIANQCPSWGWLVDKKGQLFRERSESRFVHNKCTAHQLRNTFNSEAMSLVISLLEPRSSAILRQACSTVV